MTKIVFSTNHINWYFLDDFPIANEDLEIAIREKKLTKEELEDEDWLEDLEEDFNGLDATFRYEGKVGKQTFKLWHKASEHRVWFEGVIPKEFFTTDGCQFLDVHSNMYTKFEEDNNEFIRLV
ncbi:hypothetical protein [Thermoactinomyces sp. DSM 45892]|uniref:hypothetical protein n=1 Tax=Thermoactinomyces sp. DSM 45892 TaxID=1882753 RepID=UPI00089696BA|nr:hypothetical protein [Thermoactinomyces sp. DSM 45892]SDX92964.1 hypothetical protein SAMN05444416_10133 [Thermoactinomyces sp. DSM 45892]